MTMLGRNVTLSAANGSTSQSGYRYGFNGKEKDNSTGEGNLDFGARIYDCRLGRWLATDPMCKIYPSLSPYNFVANTPLSAIDPDGKIIIFIGGLRMSEGAGDQPRSRYPGKYTGIYKTDVYNYWTKKKNSFGREVSMSEKFRNSIGNDEKVLFTSGSAEFTSQADTRANDGFARALQFHQMVKDGLIKIDKDETIKIVSHSQGGAHASGFVLGLQVINVLLGTNYKVEAVYNITPHQPTDITLISQNVEKGFKNGEDIRQVQYSHPNDAVSSDDPVWLPNGKSKFGKMNNVTEFDGRDIMCGLRTFKFLAGTAYRRETTDHVPAPGQIHSTGAAGNRGGHNVEDNDFIFSIPKGSPGYVAPRKDTPKK
jgi:RHS repeat-associated protein